MAWMPRRGETVVPYDPIQRPDFLLFSVKHGLLVVEVKDWLVQQILEADTHRVILTVNGRRESRTHPDKQARGYVNTWSSSHLQETEFIRRMKACAAGKCMI